MCFLQCAGKGAAVLGLKLEPWKKPGTRPWGVFRL